MADLSTSLASPSEERSLVTRRRAGRRIARFRSWAFFRNRVAAVALVVLALLVIVAIFAPLLAPQNPNAVSIASALQGPSARHWLGTDELGRDILSRLIIGTRVDLTATGEALLIAAGVGIPVGLLSGYVGRWLDTLLSRIADALYAFPFLILAIGIVGMLGPGLTASMVAVGVVLVPRFFRIARSSAMAGARQGYVEAARADGSSTGRILLRHILPEAASPLLVQASFSVGLIISAEAALGFLGLGVRPPEASWGSMIHEGFTAVRQSAYLLFPPTIVVCLAVMAAFLVGDGLRDVIQGGNGGGRQ